MRNFLACLILATASVSAHARDSQKTSSSASPNREALLKAAVNRDRGEITAMEPSSVEGQGVFLGYSSGTVLNCYAENTCKEYHGTPNASVGNIAISRRGKSEVLWVSYPQGALYQCTAGACKRFIWDTSKSE